MTPAGSPALSDSTCGEFQLLDRSHDARAAGGQEEQLIAGAERAGFDSPGKNAAMVEAIHVLNGKAKRLVRDFGRVRDGIERLEDGRPVEPLQVLAARGDVVALPRRDGNEYLRLDADAREKLAVLARDLVEHLLRVVDEVHLVDDDDDLAHADQPQQIPVAAGLLLHAFGRVDDDERRIGPRRARHHVLDELLVAGRVDDDVFALLGAEPDLARVDGDVLVALGLQRVHEVGELERHAAALRDRDELLVFALGQRAGVVEQPADER